MKTIHIRLQLLTLVILFLFSGIVYGIGVAPSSMTLPYEPGEIKTVEFFAENRNDFDAHVKIYMLGELENFTEISGKENIIPAKTKKAFTFKISYPPAMTPGTHTGDLYIEEVAAPEEFLKTGSAFGAKGAVIMHVSVKVPYPGRYIEVEFPPMRAVTPGEMIFFTLNTHNYGGKELSDIGGVFRIIAPDSSKIEEIETTRIDLLKPMETGELRGYWQVPFDAKAGRYRISAEVGYGGENPAIDSKDFRIGDEFIDIIGVKAQNIKGNSIGKFMIDIKSEWNQQIPDVYANIIVLYKDDTIADIKTNSIAVPALAKESLTGYWEIGDTIYEEYKARVILNFGDKSVEKIISFGPEKEAELEKPFYSKESIFIYSMTAIVIVLLVFVVVLLLRNIRMQKKGLRKNKKTSKTKKAIRKKQR